MSLPIPEAQKYISSLSDNLSQVIQGKQNKVELVILALVAGGHILIEDIPGVGKTTLARCLAKSIAGEFGRIQFTPDLLPTDITGVNFYQQNDTTRLYSSFLQHVHPHLVQAMGLSSVYGEKNLAPLTS